MKKGVVALTVIGATVGVAAVCFTGTVAACCVAAYVTIENAKAKRTRSPRVILMKKKSEPQIKEEAPAPTPEICYYAERGGVYHTCRDCRHIAGKEGIITATVQEAVTAGKERKCALCKE